MTDLSLDDKTNPMLEMRNVHKSFGPKKVLAGINLIVPREQSLVIIGGSGTGKSVMLKCLLGLMRADEGEICVEGKCYNKDHPSGTTLADLKRFGMLFQGGALFDSLPVWENIAFGLIRSGKISRSDAKELAVEKLSRVGLSSQTSTLYPAELSGGMQKRVALARAIAADPDILFFDEPTTGLDPIMSDIINELIKSCVRDLGATAVTITHDMSSVRKIADNVAMIHKGEIVWNGPVDRLDNSENDYIDQFVNGRAEGPISKHQAYKVTS